MALSHGARRLPGIEVMSYNVELKETKPQFGEPWRLIAMDRVLYPQSRARVQLTTNAFSLTLERGPTHPAAIGA